MVSPPTRDPSHSSARGDLVVGFPILRNPGESTDPTVMVLAGEASGDEHAARVIMALKARWPQSRFLGTAASE